MPSISSTPSAARRSSIPLSKRTVKLIGRITFWWMTRTSRLLRPWSMDLFGSVIGSAAYVLSRRYRNVALRNLRAAYGHKKGEREIRAIAKRVFQNFTRGAFEFFYLLSLSKEQIDAMIDIEGIEHIDQALENGRGCIIVTAHYGNWELMAREFVLQGYKLNVIARDSDDPGMTGIATKIRESGGYRVFDKDQPIIGAFRCLKGNECLGILPDQNESTGIFVDFFSRPAATATGPAVLSLRSGAPIVLAFATRTDSGRYRAVVHAPIEFTPSGDEEKDVREVMTLINRGIEQQIRRHPEQWLWLHDRWKLSPEAPSSVQ